MSKQQVTNVSFKQGSGGFHITVPYPSHTYLKRMFKLDCMPELLDLFKHCNDPVKEFTESYAAYHQLKNWHDRQRKVYHVGDGAHARTGALFAFLTKHVNYSIDPCSNSVPDYWRVKHSVERFNTLPLKIEDCHIASNTAADLFCFVHAHVDIDETLSKYKWAAAYTSACCDHAHQLTRKYKVIKEGEDWAILSPERRYQVILPK